MGFRNPITRLSELAADIITGARYRTAAAGQRIEIGPTIYDTEPAIAFYPVEPDGGFPVPARVYTDWQDAETNPVGIGAANLRLEGPAAGPGSVANIQLGDAVSDYGATRETVAAVTADYVMVQGTMFINGQMFTPPQAGVGTVVYAGATQTQNLSIVFPIPFASAPVVTLTPTDARFTVAIVAISPTSVTIQARYMLGNANAGFALGVAWLAMEAT